MKKKLAVIDMEMTKWRLSKGLLPMKHCSAIIYNLLYSKRYTEAKEFTSWLYPKADVTDTLVDKLAYKNNYMLAEIESKMKEIKELKRQVALNNKCISKLRELA